MAGELPFLLASVGSDGANFFYKYSCLHASQAHANYSRRNNTSGVTLKLSEPEFHIVVTSQLFISNLMHINHI